MTPTKGFTGRDGSQSAAYECAFFFISKGDTIMKSNSKPQLKSGTLKVNSGIRAGAHCPASGLDVNVGFQYDPKCIAGCIKPKITEECEFEAKK